MTSLLFFVYFFERFRSFNAVNIESVDQRTSKLLAVKVGGLKKKSAGPGPTQTSQPGFDSSHGPIILKI